MRGDTSIQNLAIQQGDTLTQFLHKKRESSLWYFRRRYPSKVAQAIGKHVHMQSLQTTCKREAQRRARAVAVEFDRVCIEALLIRDQAKVAAVVKSSSSEPSSTPSQVMARVPALVHRAACRVIDEQIRDPLGWRETVEKWQDFYTSALKAPMPSPGPSTAIEAQATLKGIQSALNGEYVSQPQNQFDPASSPTSEVFTGDWDALVSKALSLYQSAVGNQRYKLAVSKLKEISVHGCAEQQVEQALREWCVRRLEEVSPRTVRSQLDCMVSALRRVLPKLKMPELKELQGVMQPRVGDRESMPVQAIRDAIKVFESRPVSTKIRRDYAGGASQFDAIAIPTLAFLGIRPKELLAATDAALVTKTDFLGATGLFLRLIDGKNKASERDIPLSDDHRSVLDVDALRKMLVWQRENPRDPAVARTSLGTRFKKMTKGYTLYQMRHTWKDVAQHSGVDFELRERLMGHKVSGVAAVYGSGIPLKQGLDSLLQIRDVIHGETE